jgi:hypothetical protein
MGEANFWTLLVCKYTHIVLEPPLKKEPTNTWILLMRERLLLVAGGEIKIIHDARLIFKAVRSTISHIKKNSSHSF